MNASWWNCRSLTSRCTGAKWWLAIAFVGLFSYQCEAQSTNGPKPQPLPIDQPANDQHVIVVSLDGLAAYLVDDPKASLPTIRRLAKEGAIAVGGMKVSNPSVTWPNHTTLISGVRPEKHGVLANGVLVRSGPGVPVFVDPKRDRSELVRGATVVDLAHRAGLRTAEINWPCTRNSPAYDDRFPDSPDTLSHSTPQLRSELVALGLLDDETDKTFASKIGPARDWVWTEAACHVIRERKPHLMLVHLLNVDSTHHAAGPQTPAGYTANALMDLCLDRIVRAVDEAGIADRTTFIVVSDHGFVTTPKAIKPNLLLRNANLLNETDGKVTAARVHVYPEGGVGLVYVTNPGEAKELAASIKTIFTGQEGIADIVFPDRFGELGLPLPREYEQAPDAVLVLADGYAVSALADGDQYVVSNTDGKTSLGSHGFVASNPKMNALCVLRGNRVKAGVKLQGIENVDIAPTITKLLKLNAAEVDGYQFDGKPLDEALR